MKKCIFFISCLIAITGYGKAQSNSQLLATGNIPPRSYAGGINNISVKAMRHFLKTNPHAAQVNWMVDNGYIAKYQDELDHPCRSVYNSNGFYQYTIKQYGEASMNREVRRLVKSSYFDYTITLVEEILVPVQPVIYIVHLEDAGTLKNLRVSEGFVETIEEYHKL